MKKFCLLLVLLLLLSGCGKNTETTPTEPSAAHTVGCVDANNDGVCDVCLESVLVRFEIYSINDLHGKLADSADQPGLDELSTYFKQAQQSSNTLLLCTGDMWQGAAESNLTKGFILTDWMNEMDFAAMTLGGHEFDWGEEWVRKNQQQAQFPFLGINIYSRETNERVEYCDSSVMIDRDGVQIGIIGAVGNCYYSIASEHSKNFYFKTGAELTALVKAEAEKLRSEGADLIIYTIHDGYDQTTSGVGAEPVERQDLARYYDTSLSDGYVDLVFEADSHFWYVLIDEWGVYHLQAGGNNQGISHATVQINKANANAAVVDAQLLTNNQYSHLEEDPIVATLLEKYAQQIAPADRILGNSNLYLNSYSICQLVANLYCDKGVEKWGEQYDIVLGGGFISCRSPSYLPQGQVSYSQLQSLLPFDNPITLCTIRGDDLISKFLETDHYAYFIKTTEYYETVRHSIDPNATYYVVTDTYSAHYAPNNMTVVETYAENIFARDLVADYITAGNLG